jgi:hypothetical protein
VQQSSVIVTLPLILIGDAVTSAAITDSFALAFFSGAAAWFAAVLALTDCSSCRSHRIARHGRMTRLAILRNGRHDRTSRTALGSLAARRHPVASNL